jgi:D-alanine transaminase
MPRIAYVNGQYVPHAQAGVHIEDRGFQFADSVYEVVALMNGRLADETGHLDRLERSLSELRIPLPMNRKSLTFVMRELLRRNRLKNASIYMQITRGKAPRDFKFPKDISPTIVMTVYPATYDVQARKEAVKAVITVPDIRWKRRDIKSTALLPQVLAKQAAAEKGAYEAWMIDEKGFITEGSSSNAWIVDAKDNLITRPTAHNSILKGVTRNALQALCRREKIKIIERAFTVAEAYKAREAFTSSAVALIAPVGSIDGRKIGTGKCGPVTAKLFDMYMDYARDNPPKKQEKWNPA